MSIFKTTLRFIGFALLGIFLLMVLSGLIAFLDHRDGSFYPLVISSGITLVAALGCILFTKPNHWIDLKTGFSIVTGCWVAACFFAALPFVFYGHEFNLSTLFSRVSPA